MKKNNTTHEPASIQESEAAHTSRWRTQWTKMPFLVLCWLSYAFLVGMGAAVLFLMWPRLVQMYPAQFVFAAVAALFYIVLGAGIVLITTTVITGIDLLYPHNKPSVTVSILFPLAVQLGKLVGMSRSRLMVSYVKVNNAMTVAQRHRIHARKILVLLPHCLQIDKCDRNITHDISNCRRCGRCPVSRLLQLRDEYEIPIAVVNGGTLARKKVRSFMPDSIVAVACERDLTSGIHAVYPIPVFGVLNDRPFGPCFNTNVDIALVEQGIRFFLGKDCKEDDDAQKNMKKFRESRFISWMWCIRMPVYQWIRRVWPYSLLIKKENANARSMLARYNPSHAGRVADVGCGFGNGLNFFSCNGNYLGIDKCYPLIKKASASMPHAFIAADGNIPPLKQGTMDVVIATGVLEYQHDHRTFLESVAGLLRNRGVALVTSSPPGILTALRQLQGIPVHPVHPETLQRSARSCGLYMVEMKASLMQQQFLFLKRLPKKIV